MAHPHKERTMTTNHIDQLAEWWETAEQGPVARGDIVIKRHPDGRFTIREAEKGWENTNYRILSRAPKPKPAWRDAVAVVIARIERREVYVNMPGLGTWVNPLNSHELSTTIIEKYDPTPLIEAKVTDEMVQNALTFWEANDPEDEKWARAFITAALGLETE